MNPFIGRVQELEKLASFLSKPTSSFIVIKGRRRIGKSRLVKEFGSQFDYMFTFSGLAPTKETTKESELDEFSRQMSRAFKTAPAFYKDWGDAFWGLSEKLPKGKILLFFDEISWMGSKDPSFLAQIKNLWDLYLKNHTNLIFIICGSASSWIEKNLLSGSGFVGRISYTLTLKELSLQESYQFWPKNIDTFEKLKVLSITGGIPKYLEEINTKNSAEENIKQMAFTEGGFFVDEFDRIFSDVLLRESPYYKKIIHALGDTPKEPLEIQEALGVKSQGRIQEYLSELELAGFITRDYTWNIKTNRDSTLSRYRLSDNYMRFYVKHIEPNHSKIKRGNYSFKSLQSIPGWHAMMGLQFENLVLNNRETIIKYLNISKEDIVCENPYFQKTTTQMPGCQIDYMIQTRFQCLYICEIKFSKNPIGLGIIEEMKSKIERLKRPKGFSIRPVLIHVNGVTEDVEDTDFFSHIIDFSNA